MASPSATKRLQREYRAIAANPPQFILAKPIDTDILTWYFLISGPPDTPYDGGEYLGKLSFPADYPFKPPSIMMITPSGRFHTNMRLCLSMSDFHPESWNPAWSVSTILIGLMSFMTSEESTTGSIRTSTEERQLLAAQSRLWNRKHPIFVQVFPEWITEHDVMVMKQLHSKENPVSARKTRDTNALPSYFVSIGIGVAMLAAAIYSVTVFIAGAH